jgi:hypothetical protein
VGVWWNLPNPNYHICKANQTMRGLGQKVHQIPVARYDSCSHVMSCRTSQQVSTSVFIDSAALVADLGKTSNTTYVQCRTCLRAPVTFSDWFHRLMNWTGKCRNM